MITRQGEIWELVPERFTAWHAGKSSYKGLKNINKYFIGYEFIGSHLIGFSTAQYEAGAWLARKHMIDYNIPTSWITGHQMVSTLKVRGDPKNDPSEQFDWIRFGGLILEKN